MIITTRVVTDADVGLIPTCQWNSWWPWCTIWLCSLDAHVPFLCSPLQRIWSLVITNRVPLKHDISFMRASKSATRQIHFSPWPPWSFRPKWLMLDHPYGCCPINTAACPTPDNIQTATIQQLLPASLVIAKGIMIDAALDRCNACATTQTWRRAEHLCHALDFQCLALWYQHQHHGLD